MSTLGNLIHRACARAQLRYCILALTTCFFLIGCTDPAGISAPTNPHQSKFSRGKWKGPKGDQRDKAMIELEKTIPGFGGAYLSVASRRGKHPNPFGPVVINVYLTGSANRSRARSVLTDLFTAKHYIVQEVRVLPTAYTFGQLRAWRDQIARAIGTSVVGNVSYDADEARSRVTVGVETKEIASAIRSRAIALGIPGAALNVRVEGKIVKEQAENSTLQAPFRPKIPAGVEIGPQSGGACTLGFSAIDTEEFVTASHCTEVLFGPDTARPGFSQPRASSTIGSESWDATPWSAGSCPYNYPCRYSDAAFAIWIPETWPEYAKVARTTNQTGSIIVDQSRPRLDIIGIRDYLYVGDVVDKIGAWGGWTYGNVQQTCVDATNYQAQPRVDLICVDRADYASEVGDSGGPVLIWYLDNRVELAGLHTSRNVNLNLATISSVFGIELDYGPLPRIF